MFVYYKIDKVSINLKLSIFFMKNKLRIPAVFVHVSVFEIVNVVSVLSVTIVVDNILAKKEY